MGVLDILEKPLVPNDEKMIWENRKEDFLTNLLARESGWVIDSGGGTRYGISERAHGKDTIIWDLGPEDAKNIYRKEYLHRGEKFFGQTPEALKFMDMEVNIGYKSDLKKIIQTSLNSLLPENQKIEIDGKFGDSTKKAIKIVQENFGSQMLINEMIKNQKQCYRGLEDYSKYGRGWEKRAEYNPIKDD